MLYDVNVQHTLILKALMKRALTTANVPLLLWVKAVFDWRDSGKVGGMPVYSFNPPTPPDASEA